MKSQTLVDSTHLALIIDRLCYQLIENHNRFDRSAIIGLQPRGVFLAQRLVQRLRSIQPKAEILMGQMDVTFFRDDFRRNEKPLLAQQTDITFSIENRHVVLVDDVLYTGRTIRAGLEALLDFGRPASVELLVLIDRRFSRELPIEATYTGLSVDSYDNQKVKVKWKEQGGADKVILLTETDNS